MIHQSIYSTFGVTDEVLYVFLRFTAKYTSKGGFPIRVWIVVCIVCKDNSRLLVRLLPASLFALRKLFKVYCSFYHPHHRPKLRSPGKNSIYLCSQISETFPPRKQINCHFFFWVWPWVLYMLPKKGILIAPLTSMNFSKLLPCRNFSCANSMDIIVMVDRKSITKRKIGRNLVRVQFLSVEIMYRLYLINGKDNVDWFFAVCTLWLPVPCRRFDRSWIAPLFFATWSKL